MRVTLRDEKLKKKIFPASAYKILKTVNTKINGTSKKRL